MPSMQVALICSGFHKPARSSWVTCSLSTQTKTSSNDPFGHLHHVTSDTMISSAMDSSMTSPLSPSTMLLVDVHKIYHSRSFRIRALEVFGTTCTSHHYTRFYHNATVLFRTIPQVAAGPASTIVEILLNVSQAIKFVTILWTGLSKKMNSVRQ